MVTDGHENERIPREERAKPGCQEVPGTEKAETSPQTGMAGLAPAVATATPLLTSPCSRFHTALEQLEMDLTFVRPWCPAYFETTASAFFVSPA